MNKEMTIGTLKAEYSNVIDSVLNGETYIVLTGRNKKEKKNRVENSLVKITV